MRTKLALTLLVAVLGLSAQGASHTATLTWQDPNNPAGTTYNIKRASGLCTGSPAFSTIATAIAAKTYVDNTIVAGNYCYAVSATSSGVESANSNTALAPIGAFAPQNLTVNVQ